MSTIEKIQEEVLVEEAIGLSHEIVLHNDDVNPPLPHESFRVADNKVNTPPEKPFHKRFAGVPEKSAGFQTKDTRLSKQRCSALRRKMPGFFARDENIFYFSIRKNLKIILKNNNYVSKI